MVVVVSIFFSLANLVPVPVLSFTKVSVPDPKKFLIDPDPRGQLYSEQAGSGSYLDLSVAVEKNMLSDTGS